MKKLMTLLAVMAILLVPSAAFAQDDAAVSVVHGIPDLDVDVWVNGEATLPGFAFQDVAGPLALPAGDYEIEIYPAGTDPEGNEPALAATVPVPAGVDATIVAHLDADGAPMLTVFVNDTSAIDAGNGRVTARHVAAAPTVDILANDDALFAGVSNPNEGVADVPADTYNVKIVPAGATDPVVFETDLAIPEGTNVIVYAVGSLDGGTFAVVAQPISGLGSAPAGVPTGSGGLAGGTSPFVMATLLLGGVAIVGGSLLLRRSN